MPENTAISIPLKQKYLVAKSAGNNSKTRTGSRKKKQSVEVNLRPRRKAYGPF